MQIDRTVIEGERRREKTLLFVYLSRPRWCFVIIISHIYFRYRTFFTNKVLDGLIMRTSDVENCRKKSIESGVHITEELLSQSFKSEKKGKRNNEESLE